MSNEIPTTKRRGRPRKADTEYTNNPNANAVRAYRERKRAENEAKLIEEQRVYKNHYNKNWKDIREAKPDYKSTDPTYEELAEARYNKPEPEPENHTEEPNTPTDETQQQNNDIQVDKNEDNTEPKVSVKITLPDVDETLEKIEKGTEKRQ